MENTMIERIHDCPWKGVIAVTGCAPGIVYDLLSPGGGSATLLEAVVPYDPEALKQFIGKKPDKFCSPEVASEMASAAYSRATALRQKGSGVPVFGLGITATLRKNGPEREGRIHQVFISYQTCNVVYSHHVVFNSKISRQSEEYLVTQIALAILAKHLLDEHYDVLLPLGMQLVEIEKSSDWWLVKESVEKQQFSTELQHLLDGQFPGEEKAWEFDRDFVALDERSNRIVIPGSFNPFHRGHHEMVAFALKYFSQKPILELSISNVDKGRLSGYEILKRGHAIKDYCLENDVTADLYITDSPTALEKSFLFPGSVFVIGIDTWYRIIDPKYYNYDQKIMDESLAKIKENHCKFLVLGRFIHGQYHTLPSDTTTHGLATGLDEKAFRVDISSTQLRGQR